MLFSLPPCLHTFTSSCMHRPSLRLSPSPLCRSSVCKKVFAPSDTSVSSVCMTEMGHSSLKILDLLLILPVLRELTECSKFSTVLLNLFLSFNFVVKIRCKKYRVHLAVHTNLLNHLIQQRYNTKPPTLRQLLMMQIHKNSTFIQSWL